MSSAIGRGAQSMHTGYFKPMLRKAYHRKSGCTDGAKLNQEEAKNKSVVCSTGGSSQEADFWIPDGRTGIYYPKGKEKVMEDVPPHAAKDFTVNWFSNA